MAFSRILYRAKETTIPAGPGRRGRGALLAALLALMAASCADPGTSTDSTSTSVAEQPDTTDGSTDTTEGEGSGESSIRIATSSEPPSMDAHRVGAGPVMNVYANIFETLTNFNADGTLVPVLAAELPENIEEARWRVQLRKGVTFHNGEPFNADAVILNIERMTDPEVGSVFFDSVESIVGVERVDDYTVDILTAGFDVLLPSRLFYVQMLAPSTIEDGSLTEVAYGTGPYMVDTWERGSSITLVQYEDYWGESPEIENVEFVFLPDAGTRVAALLSDEVDVITGLLPDDVGQVPKSAVASDQAAVFWQPHCLPGMVTADPMVRIAMQHAVDQESIATDLYGGTADPIYGAPVADSWFGFDPDVGRHEYDPDLARSMIEDAGAVGGQVRIVYDAGRWPRVDEIAQVLTAAWTDIGLEVTLDNQDGEAWIDVLLGRVTQSEVIMVQAGNEFFDTSLVAEKYWHPGSDRTTCDDNARIGEALDQAIATTDQNLRLELYHEAIGLVHAGAYSNPIVGDTSGVVGMAENVTWEPGVEAMTVVANMSIDG